MWYNGGDGAAGGGYYAARMPDAEAFPCCGFGLRKVRSSKLSEVAL